MRAVERLDRFRGESALTSWLGGVLVNVWRESRRELRWIADDEPEASLEAEAPMPDAASGTSQRATERRRSRPRAARRRTTRASSSGGGACSRASDCHAAPRSGSSSILFIASLLRP